MGISQIFQILYLIRSLVDGRLIFRVFRTTSALEGLHQSQGKSLCAQGSYASLRVQNMLLRWWEYIVGVRAAIKAGFIPRIDHHELHLRYHLISCTKHSTIFKDIPECQSWKDIDFSIPPIIPRGVDCSSLLPQDPNAPLPTPPVQRHSTLSAQNYALIQLNNILVQLQILQIKMILTRRLLLGTLSSMLTKSYRGSNTLNLPIIRSSLPP
jgi:hypothetical protein